MRLCGGIPGGISFHIGVAKNGSVVADYGELCSLLETKLGVNFDMRRKGNWSRLVVKQSEFPTQKVVILRDVIDKIPSSFWGENNSCGCYLKYLCRISRNHPADESNPTNEDIPPDPPNSDFVRCAEVPLRNPQVQARAQYIRMVTLFVEGQIAQGWVLP